MLLFSLWWVVRSQTSPCPGYAEVICALILVWALAHWCLPALLPEHAGSNLQMKSLWIFGVTCKHCSDLEEGKPAALCVELHLLSFVSVRMRVTAAEIQISCTCKCMHKAGLPCCTMQWRDKNHAVAKLSFYGNKLSQIGSNGASVCYRQHAHARTHCICSRNLPKSYPPILHKTIDS